MKFLTLNNNTKIPILGLGTWLAKAGEVKQAVLKAIDLGYRHFDCAYAYLNEGEIGEAIKEKISDGTVKREDLYVVTKLWNNFHHPDYVERGFKLSLQNLGLEYIDLYLMHSPMGYKDGEDPVPVDESGDIKFSDVDYIDTWKAMEKLVDQGLAKSIGISNFDMQQIQRVLDNCKIKPAMLQIELHPYFPCFKTQEFCSKHGIALTAYSPLGAPARPETVKAETPSLLENSKIKDIAAKYGKTPAQVLIRYPIQRGIVVIPKSINPERLASNFQVFDFELSDEDMNVLNSFNVYQKFLSADERLRRHKYFPQSDE